MINCNIKNTTFSFENLLPSQFILEAKYERNFCVSSDSEKDCISIWRACGWRGTAESKTVLLVIQQYYSLLFQAADIRSLLGCKIKKQLTSVLMISCCFHPLWQCWLWRKTRYWHFSYPFLLVSYSGWLCCIQDQYYDKQMLPRLLLSLS